MTMLESLPEAPADAKPGKAGKPTEATRFPFMGEFLDADQDDSIDLPALRKLLAQYAAEADVLREAKAKVFLTEDKIKEIMRGYEHLRVDGEIIASWKWANATEFDKGAFKAKHPKLCAKFERFVPRKSRRFNFKGVVGVD